MTAVGGRVGHTRDCRDHQVTIGNNQAFVIGEDLQIANTGIHRPKLTALIADIGFITKTDKPNPKLTRQGTVIGRHIGRGMNLNRARCIEASGRDVSAISESDGGRVVDVCPVNQNIDVTNRRTARAQAVTVFRKFALFKRVVRIK